MAANTLVEISARAAQTIVRGHLWIYSNEFQSTLKDLKPGEWVHFTHQGSVVATGYVNPHSLIAGRVVGPGPTEADQSRPAILEKRLRAAMRRREGLLTLGSLRLVSSEADFLPGLVIDWYSGVLVLQSNTAGIDECLNDLGELVPRLFEETFKEKAKAFVLRGDSFVRNLEGLEDFHRIAFGDEKVLSQGSFQENGVWYAANFLEGQKTGFFLDQRDNRRAVRDFSKGCRVLDLCCYSGGWGLSALAGSAKHVTFVDQSDEALHLVHRGAKLNGFADDKIRTVQDDVFDFLGKEPQSFDLIIADPPAFVKNKKHLPQGLKAYEKLNRLALRKLSPEGILFTCSCSFHVKEPDFQDVVRTALSKEKAWAHVIYRGGQGLDHPYLFTMPETFYLKCLGLKKILV